MREILVRVNNTDHVDPVKDRRGCYKRGMPDLIFNGGHTWGKLESKQQWIREGFDPALWPSQGVLIIVKISDAVENSIPNVSEEQREDDVGAAQSDVYRRRRWRFNLDGLPAGVRNTLVRDGEITTTRAQIRPFVLRVRDNAQFTAVNW